MEYRFSLYVMQGPRSRHDGEEWVQVQKSSQLPVRRMAAHLLDVMKKSPCSKCASKAEA